MDQDSQQKPPDKDSPIVDLRKWRVSRRKLLGIMGASGAAAMAALALPSFLSKRIAGADSAQKYEPPRRIRKWAMVIDLRRCDGCQGVDLPPQCTIACIQGHLASEPMEWIQVFEHELPGGGTQFIPTPCQHCQNPPCVNVCPVAATWVTPEGTVLIDQHRCIGCRVCMAACPYDRRFLNWGTPPVPPENLLADYDPEHQHPVVRGTVMKCDFCSEMARSGKLPHCAQACPTNAIYYGDLEEDIATNGVEVVKLTRFLSENQSFRQKEHLGTKPRVFYIPGHGEAIGRDSNRRGRKPTVWPWQTKIKGATTWKR